MIFSRPSRWFLLVTFVILVTLPSSVQSLAAGSKREVLLRAGNYGFSPALIFIEPGDEVTIELISTDSAHGIFIDEYGVSARAYPGGPVSVTFTANKVGSFRIHCTVNCGALHPFMIGKLIVGRNDRFIKGLVLLSAIIALAGWPLKPAKKEI